MNSNQLLDEILGAIRTVKDNKEKLEKLHEFIFDEIYEDPEEEEIPEKYQKAVSNIADSLLAGFICYFNPDTLEVEDVSQGLIEDAHEFEMMTGFIADEMNIKHDNWEKCIEIEPMESHDSFKVMEYYVDNVDNQNLQNKLFNALNRRKPFANFKYLVENSDYRQEWFDFRQKQWEMYVWDKISFKIEE